MPFLKYVFLDGFIMKTMPAWKCLGNTQTMEVGDIAVYFNSLTTIPNPESITTAAWGGDKGIRVTNAWSKLPVAHLGFMSQSLQAHYYAVLRKRGASTRVYKPSKWADPVPLP